MLAARLDTALTELASATQEHRAPAALPPLREAQQELSARVGAAAPLAEETDRIVNSVVIAADVLTRRAWSTGQAAASAARGQAPATA